MMRIRQLKSRTTCTSILLAAMMGGCASVGAPLGDLQRLDIQHFDGAYNPCAGVSGAAAIEMHSRCFAVRISYLDPGADRALEEA